MIQLANDTDLKTVLQITRDTISKIYPKYYAKGVVEFFLQHHKQDKVLEDIENERVWLLEDDGYFVPKGNTEAEMTFEKATINDIKELTALRIAYLQEDGGDMSQKVLHTIEVDLPNYFANHLNNDITAYIARTDVEVVSCAFLLVMEKPMSPAFITGKTGTVLNVYTRPKYRHKGYAKRLMNMLLKDASNMNLSFVELKATEDGYGLYKSLGFEDEISKYHSMRWYHKEGGHL